MKTNFEPCENLNDVFSDVQSKQEESAAAVSEFQQPGRHHVQSVRPL